MNTEKIKKFDQINQETLHSINGGAPWYLPLLPTYEQIGSSICGFMDGIKGRKNKGSC